MIGFALRGLLARKLRTALTAIGVVLGVALVSGTYVLTDSISTAFDSIFSENYKNTDAAITGKTAFDVPADGTALAPPFDESLLATITKLPEVGVAGGAVSGEAQLIGKDGKAIVFGGAPNLGFSIDRDRPEFNTLALVKGDWPGPDQVVIDTQTASKKGFAAGDMIGVQARGQVQQMQICRAGRVRCGLLDRRRDAGRLPVADRATAVRQARQAGPDPARRPRAVLRRSSSSRPFRKLCPRARRSALLTTRPPKTQRGRASS